jgi:hypothetical protein
MVRDVAAMTADADLTRRELQFGAQDPITGWYREYYTESTIEGSIQPKGANMAFLPCGSYARYDNTLFTEYVVHPGDEIVDQDLAVFKINTSQKWTWLDKFSHRTCEAIIQPFANRDATSGVWHMDSEAVKTDPRNRIKTCIDLYMDASHIKKANGITNAATITCFDGASYPITRLFLTLDLDVVAVISRKPTTTHYTSVLYNKTASTGHKPYAFQEQVQIDIYAVDKTGITAANLTEQYEQEIRRIFTTYDAYSTVRDLDVISPSLVDLGYGYMHHTAMMIKYKRPNDDYTPAYPTLTWGPSTSPTGTYVYPNSIDESCHGDTSDIWHHPFGSLGDITDNVGDTPLIIKIKSDLDIDSAGYTWLRPQTTTPKTDAMKWKIFLEMKHNGAANSTEPYQTLTLSWGQFKVRLVSWDINTEGDMTVLYTTFKEYREDSADAETVDERFGI